MSLDAALARRTESLSRCAELEKWIADFESQRQNKTKEMEKEIAAAKKKHTEMTKQVKQVQQQLVSQYHCPCMTLT